MSDLLLDTNMLIYPYDPRDADKQLRAWMVVRSAVPLEKAVVGFQCLSEFYHNVTRKLPFPLTPQQAAETVENLTQACRVIDLTADIVLAAVHAVTHSQMAIWDALIWAIAELNGVPYVLTEDMQSGRRIGSVTYINPLLPDFDVQTLATL